MINKNQIIQKKFKRFDKTNLISLIAVLIANNHFEHLKPPTI